MRRLKPVAIVWLAVAGLAITVGAAALPLPGRFAGQSGLPTPDAPALPTGAVGASLDPILAMTPFGEPVRSAGSAEAAAETSLGLTLHGVAIAAQSADSSAIVSGGLVATQLYVVGDAVTDAAVLNAVFSDHVQLAIDGRIETLSFPEAHAQRSFSQAGVDIGVTPAPASGESVEASVDEEEGLAAAGLAALRGFLASARGEDAAGTDVVAAPEPERDLSVDEAANVSAALPEDPAELADSLRRRFKEDPADVLNTFGLTATPKGYSVGEGHDALARMGLQAGDLISKLNGRGVGNVDADAAIVDEAFASGHLRVEFERSGRTMRLSIPLW